MFSLLKKLIPSPLLHLGRPVYHFFMSWLGAIIYRAPSRKINIVAVTGTKGKTTTIELVSAMLEKAGYCTALTSTLHFKIGGEDVRNTEKMTMPGRLFLQRFLRRAVNAGCDYAVVEMTSEGAKQYRHRFIHLDALIFTNLAPEHIESHGSFEKYKQAKLAIARQLERSKKKDKVLVVNADDDAADDFLAINVPIKKTFSLEKTKVYDYHEEGVLILTHGDHLSSPLPGTFNAANILAAVAYTETQNISFATIKEAVEEFRGVAGRVQEVDEGQPFTVIVDYAHTPDSLEKLYDTFADRTLVCVLGSAGGGRDTWKRGEMGSIADKRCDAVYLTDEDPYDEDPGQIVEEIRAPITHTPVHVIMDRRQAIRAALEDAAARPKPERTAVLITGKGTDPYIMGPNGSKQPWSDEEVTREELRAVLT